MKATCDKCGKVFKVKYKQKIHAKHFKEDKQLRKITETYFKCPHCKHHYFCFARDEEVLESQEKIKTVESPFIRAGMQQQINKRMKELKGMIKR